MKITGFVLPVQISATASAPHRGANWRRPGSDLAVSRDSYAATDVEASAQRRRDPTSDPARESPEFLEVGAGGRARTDTPIKERDFESRASTNFTTPACRSARLEALIDRAIAYRQAPGGIPEGNARQSHRSIKCTSKQGPRSISIGAARSISRGQARYGRPFDRICEPLVSRQLGASIRRSEESCR